MGKKIGFIGCGNMGKSMVSGLINSKFVKTEDIIVSEHSQELVDKLAEELNVKALINNKELAKEVDLIVLAVKPNVYEEVVKEIKSELTADKIIVTIGAGITLEKMTNWLGEGYKIVRTMPNTPALVGEGMAAVCPNKNVTKEELQFVMEIFNSFGKCVELEEKYFHGFVSLCGSSPAYVFMFIEAMADAAVQLGIPRAKAYTMASQSVLGSAKMVLETGKHPGELKDMVCSPAGTTIDAVVELEKTGFRYSVMSAMKKCAEKSEEMS